MLGGPDPCYVFERGSALVVATTLLELGVFGVWNRCCKDWGGDSKEDGEYRGLHLGEVVER